MKKKCIWTVLTSKLYLSYLFLPLHCRNIRVPFKIRKLSNIYWWLLNQCLDPKILPDLQMSMFKNCLDISFWVSQRHIKLSISESKFITSLHFPKSTPSHVFFDIRPIPNYCQFYLLSVSQTYPTLLPPLLNSGPYHLHSVITLSGLCQIWFYTSLSNRMTALKYTSNQIQIELYSHSPLHILT